ncbi:hypothetical protein TEA_003816 [Camellia sinensis var. sinensis]|uniref:Uncharacterized protein n=2 Tax=Camellia sinensis TaxID=4442 RepID=A0A4S4E8F5_CAMSN|nr:hypothetical protein TEA_003816 [Camellia sinensis var. sinensis]
MTLFAHHSMMRLILRPSIQARIGLKKHTKEKQRKSRERERERERGEMEAMGGWCCSSSSRGVPLINTSPKKGSSKLSRKGHSVYLPTLLVKSMATQKPAIPSPTKTVASAKNPPVFPLGEKGPRNSYSASTTPVKLLTRVEQLRLLTKAEKAGLLSAAEKFGLSLSTIEKLGLLSKAEGLGVLSAATDPGTPTTLLSLSLALLVLGPACVYLVPEEYPWEVALQVVVALVSVVGGSAAFAASNFVSNLQKSY